MELYKSNELGNEKTPVMQYVVGEEAKNQVDGPAQGHMASKEQRLNKQGTPTPSVLLQPNSWSSVLSNASLFFPACLGEKMLYSHPYFLLL